MRVLWICKDGVSAIDSCRIHIEPLSSSYSPCYRNRKLFPSSIRFVTIRVDLLTGRLTDLGQYITLVPQETIRRCGSPALKQSSFQSTPLTMKTRILAIFGNHTFVSCIWFQLFWVNSICISPPRDEPEEDVVRRSDRFGGSRWCSLEGPTFCPGGRGATRPRLLITGE